MAEETSTVDKPKELGNVTIVSKSKSKTDTIVGNVAPLINSNTLNNLKSIKDPKAFGDQALDIAKASVIIAEASSTRFRLKKRQAELYLEGQELDIKHRITLEKIDFNHTPKKQVQNGEIVDIPPFLDDEEYQQAIDTENKNYKEAKDNLQERKDQWQKDWDDFLKDPHKKRRLAKEKRKKARDARKARTKEEKRKARKEKAKAILKNTKSASKSLIPVVTLFLTNKIAEIIAQNDTIKKLVDDTNKIITDANDTGDLAKLNNAKLVRDNAIKIIQSNENKIIKIQKDIDNISIYISIFSIIVTIISSIPIPTAVPPGIGIPVNLIMKFVKILDKANRIVLALSALIPILSTVLDKVISILNDYKSQLLNINGQLDKAVANGTGNTSLLSIGGVNIGLGTLPSSYKGFKFAIKEDKSFGGISVGGFKRHYAVAIDIYGVEILKSEFSFTLDPNDLIEQLKLVIDQNNLQG
jgi:hypothetical protein